MKKGSILKRAAYIILPLLAIFITVSSTYAQSSDGVNTFGTRVYTDAEYKARTVADIMLKRASLTSDQYNQVYKTTYNLVQSNDKAKVSWGQFKKSMKSILDKSQQKQLQSSKSEIQSVLGNTSTNTFYDDGKKDKDDKRNDEKVKKHKEKKDKADHDGKEHKNKSKKD